jgi:hypothetical protein
VLSAPALRRRAASGLDGRSERNEIAVAALRHLFLTHYQAVQEGDLVKALSVFTNCAS